MRSVTGISYGLVGMILLAGVGCARGGRRCLTVEEIKKICEGEAPSAVQEQPQAETKIYICSYVAERPLLQVVVSPVWGKKAARRQFDFGVRPFFKDQEILASDEIGIVSLRTKLLFGVATSSRVILVSERNENKTCRPEDLLALGRFFVN